MKTFIKYFIMDKDGFGLHYIQGKLHWRYCDSIEAVENFTSFSTMKELLDFVKERNIKEFDSIGTIKIKVV